MAHDVIGNVHEQKNHTFCNTICICIGKHSRCHRSAVGNLFSRDSRNPAWYETDLYSSCFGQVYLKIIYVGKSADEIGRMKDSDNAQFQRIFEDATFKWYIFRLRVKMEMYNVSCTV